MRTSPQSLDHKEDCGAQQPPAQDRVQKLKLRALFVTLISAIPLAVLQLTVGIDNIEGYQATIAAVSGLGVVGGLCTLKMFALADSIDRRFR